MKISNSVFSTVIDESFWLQLFFVVSGFLLSFSEIQSFRALIKKSVKRLFRLYLPIEISCIIIYILSKTIGFYNVDTQRVFLCDWFQRYYRKEFAILDLIIKPIKTVVYGGAEFNGPFWVIKDMFYASLFIYLINYVSLKLSDKVKFIVYILVILVVKYVFGTIYFSCLVGALSGFIIRNNKIMNKLPNTINGICCTLCIVMSLGGQKKIFLFLSQKFSTNFILCKLISCFEFNNSIWGTLYFAVFIIFVYYNKSVKEKLSKDILCNLNKISFGIYSFHWPVMCSIGALCIIKMSDLFMGIICGWLISFELTICISILYHIVESKIKLK